MVVDCEECPLVQVGCEDCVVSVVLGRRRVDPASAQGRFAGRVRRALDTLAEAGMLPAAELRGEADGGWPTGGLTDAPAEVG